MKRELLEFSIVDEFPKDSRSTFASIISLVNSVAFDPQKNFNNNFEVSVLPEPDSPLITIDCGVLNICWFILTSLARRIFLVQF